ncbi:ABC transporter permease (plasmid) [Streptomyces sp. NBC_00523]|uniref:ABC transporter permease n=1 Tax=Streptomyces sp. NBC_00523 TaxID=2975765 RepID=UPI002E802F61|nr:FtsX-like permease family protein [Streptomyces sp. NBC_00523]WUD04497.1 ABC transporter permease [Streptomyces sp. NBC_00523]
MTVAVDTLPPAGRTGSRKRHGESVGRVQRTARFLARRSMRLHRKAWAAVFAALVLTALLLGSFALATLSAFVGHAHVERYAATIAVVAADQTTRYRAKPWGDPMTTVTQSLTERVRVPAAVVARVAEVPGVRAAVPDSSFPVALADPDGRGVPGPDSDSGTAPVYGHGWPTAALAPFTLRAGKAPAGARQVAVDGDLAARAGVRPGDRLRLQMLGAPAEYVVSGIVAPKGEADDTGLGHQGAVFFTEGEAGRLSGHPGTVDAIGVLADDGVSVHELYPALRKALAGEKPARDAVAGSRDPQDSSLLRVLTGNGRGQAEFLDAAPSRAGLLNLLAMLCATVIMIAVLVVAGTVTQAVHQRARELALLRAVGATPWQLRVTVGREVTGVATTAAVVGAVGAVPVFLMLLWMLRDRGAVPVGLDLPVLPWMFATPVLTAVLTLVVARVAAALACGRIAKIRPAQALGEAQSEPGQPGRGRTVTGLIVLFAGLSSAGTAALQSGEPAAMAAGSAALALVIACALLGPWIARGAMRLLAPPARKLGGAGGYLAAASTTANSRRLGAGITPVVLVVAFVGVQLAAGATMDHEGSAQARQAMRANLVVTTEDTGLPAGAARRVAAVPGVEAATGALHSTVVLARKEAGDPVLERLPVVGVTPGALPAALDPDVTSGSLRDLREGTVAIGAARADALDAGVGSTVRLRYGDGVTASLRVVAVYERSLALGDFLFAREALAHHVTTPLDTRILARLAPDADEAAVREAVDKVLSGAVLGARVTAHPSLEHLRSADRGVSQVLTAVAVGVVGGFTVIAVLSTLVLIVIGRRQELVLLRLVGAGRGQVRRMLRVEAAIVIVTGLVVGALAALIPLTAFSLSVTGSLPYLPPVQVAAIVLVVVVTVAAGVLLPARPALRRRRPGALRRI